MENASKGLLISASVLIVIIIITVGIKIFTSTSNTQKVATDTGNTISDKTGKATDSVISAITGKDTPSSSAHRGTSTTTTNQVYAVGDVVTLGREDFYVIEASDASATTVKLLAEYNVKTTSGEGQYTQTVSANYLRFDDDSNDYATSEIKMHVDAYKTALEGRMGKATQEVRLMTKEEVEALGGSNYSTSGCPAFINNRQYYWLGSPFEGSINRVWILGGSGSHRLLS